MTKHRVEQPLGLNRSRPMHSSQAAVFFCGIFLQRFTCVACGMFITCKDQNFNTNKLEYKEAVLFRVKYVIIAVQIDYFCSLAAKT